MPSRRLLLALLALAACDSMPATACEPTGTLAQIDVNGDGRPDVRKYTLRGEEVCRDTDLDFDGRPDTIVVSDAGRGVRWTGSDLDGDGRCDHVEVHVDGQPTRVFTDADHDGRPDQRRPPAAP